MNEPDNAVDQNMEGPGAGDPGSKDSAEAMPTGGAAPAQPVEFADLPDTEASSESKDNLSLILEIPVTCSVELGRSSMQIGDLLKLTRGSVVNLERPAGTPLDILVNGCLIAHGEVVTVSNKFAVRLLDIVDRRERLKSVS